MNPGDTMTVIRAAGSPEVLVPYTSDRTMLRDAINGAQPSDASADWNAALTLAAAGSAGSADFSAVIIGDGGLGDSVRLPAIPGTLRYIPIGRSDDNLAISALATRTLPGQAAAVVRADHQLRQRRRQRGLRPARRWHAADGAGIHRSGPQQCPARLAELARSASRRLKPG